MTTNDKYLEINAKKAVLDNLVSDLHENKAKIQNEHEYNALEQIEQKMCYLFALDTLKNLLKDANAETLTYIHQIVHSEIRSRTAK